MNDLQRNMYADICRHDGIKAKEIAKEIGEERGDINRQLYLNPFVHELCYRDEEYLWHGLIRQMRPHIGLSDFCGYYGAVARFLSQPEDEWLEELKEGCRGIGRNLNDTRGLIHSFLDARSVMIGLFQDLGGLDFDDWEICFELRIRRARHVRIYADVLVITEDKVFSLEFKMKDVIEEEEELQAAKYAGYLDVIFGDPYEIIPALVLTRAEDLYIWKELPGSTAMLPVCSGDMLFNLFDEYLGFLE
ncbi:MAG: helix-turn-helix domain containing protein [Blautia sp.]|nr:helix-turn-helix domain containing protein [Blautia sp.]